MQFFLKTSTPFNNIDSTKNQSVRFALKNQRNAQNLETTTMNSGSGIQELMAAETRASQIVAEARIGQFSSGNLLS